MTDRGKEGQKANRTQAPLCNLDKKIYFFLSLSSHSWFAFLALAPSAVLM